MPPEQKARHAFFARTCIFENFALALLLLLLLLVRFPLGRPAFSRPPLLMLEPVFAKLAQPNRSQKR